MTKPTVAAVANLLTSNVDWPRFARLTRALGKQLNTEQLRFMKAIIFEKSLVPYSKNMLKYIADEGRDFYIPSLDIYLEMKYIENVLFTPARKQLREKTGNIKLMNSNGTNSHKVLPNTYADFLLVVGNQGVMLFGKSTVDACINPKGDGITANIKTADGILISSPKEMTGDNQSEVDFLGPLMIMIDKFIENNS
jgi:hypothetical protein